MKEIEIHPFQPFIPKNITTLIVGSFPGREQTQGAPDENQWIYGAKRNQFWRIISGVYDVNLNNKEDKQNLFENAGIGAADIFLKVRRKANNNMDENLEIIEFNSAAIDSILKSTSISRIFFTSRFVEKHFLKLFPGTTNAECLPSPSPRFARMSIQEKINYYKIKLPNL